PVIIGQTRPPVAPAFDAALELGKDADSLSEMRVGVEQIALQQITVIILWPCAEIELAEVFVADPRLTAERQVPAMVVQRDVFQPGQAFGPPGFIFQIAPVFIVPQRLEGWRRLRRRCGRSGGRGRSGLHSLGESLYADAGDRDDHKYIEHSFCCLTFT